METSKVRKIAAKVNKSIKDFRKQKDVINKFKEATKMALDSYSKDGNHKPDFDKNMKLAKKYSSMINEETQLKNGFHEGTNVKIISGENAGKTGTITYSAGMGTHHSVESGKTHLGFHPSSNLLNIEKQINEQREPHIGSKVRAIRGGENGRIERIAADKNGIEKVFFKTDDGRIIDTPLTNVKLEKNMNYELLTKVKQILAESALLLEYNEEKTWGNYGSKISNRLSQEGHPVENHREIFNNAIQKGDPTKNKEYGKWIAEKYASGGINRLEDVVTRIKPALEIFHDHKKRGTLGTYGIHPDINKYKTTQDIVDVSRQLPEKVETETSIAKTAKKEAADSAMRHKVGENEHWEHFMLHKDNNPTHEESRFLAHKYGGGTGGDMRNPGHCEWCTAANSEDSKETMNYYLKDDPLHIFIPKNPIRPHERYQSHLDSNQFMNEKDEDQDPMKVFGGRPMPKSYDDHLNQEVEKLLKNI